MCTKVLFIVEGEVELLKRLPSSFRKPPVIVEHVHTHAAIGISEAVLKDTAYRVRGDACVCCASRWSTGAHGRVHCGGCVFACVCCTTFFSGPRGIGAAFFVLVVVGILVFGSKPHIHERKGIQSHVCVGVGWAAMRWASSLEGCQQLNVPAL